MLKSLLIIIISISILYSQNKILSYFEKNDTVGLDNYLFSWHQNSKDSTLVMNDTIKMVFEIHKLIYSEVSNNWKKYFFIQTKYPLVYINSKNIPMPESKFYNPYFESDLSYTISYNVAYINEIKDFILTKTFKDYIIYNNYTITNHLRTHYPDSVLRVKIKNNERRIKSEYLSKFIDVYLYFNKSILYPIIEIEKISLNIRQNIAIVEFTEKSVINGNIKFEYINSKWLITESHYSKRYPQWYD